MLNDQKFISLKFNNRNLIEIMASQHLKKYPIPGSFPELLRDFTMAVLRDQPENIYEYGAAYFAAMDEEEEF